MKENNKQNNKRGKHATNINLNMKELCSASSSFFNVVFSLFFYTVSDHGVKYFFDL